MNRKEKGSAMAYRPQRHTGRRFLSVLLSILTLLMLSAACYGFDSADEFGLRNVSIDENGHMVLSTGAQAADPDKIVIPFDQEVGVTFLYEGAEYVSDFGWMLHEDAADTDGNFRGWNNIPTDKKHVLFVKIRDDAEGSGCCNGGDGILDTDYGADGGFPVSDETALAQFHDGSGVLFVTDGDGTVTPADMKKSLGLLPGGTEVVFFLTADERYTTTDADSVFFTKTAWNTDSYTGCTPPAGDSLWADEASGIFDKEYDLGSFLDPSLESSGTCSVRSQWLTEPAFSRLTTYFGITLSGMYYLRIQDGVAGKFPHVIAGTPSDDPDQWILGWEDLRNGGDADHNDMVFRIEGKSGGEVRLKTEAAVTPADPDAVWTGATIEVYDYIPAEDMNIRYYVSTDGGTAWTGITEWDTVVRSDANGGTFETVGDWSPGTPAYTRRTAHVTGIPSGRLLVWKAELTSPDSTQSPRILEVTVSGDGRDNSCIALNGAIGVWLMEEGEGTAVADISGNNNDAVLACNSNSSPPEWRTDAGEGRNVYFSTEARWNSWYGNYADLGALDISSGTDKITVGCMFRADPDQDSARLFSARRNSDEKYLDLTASGDGSFYFQIRTADGDATYRTPAGKFQPGEWTLVVASYDGQTARIHADGQEVFSSSEYSGNLQYVTGTHTYISAFQTDSSLYPLFDGNMAFAFVYDRVLTPEEISLLHEKGKGAFCTDNPAIPVITFTADPTEIAAGASSTLSWNVADADTVTIDNGIGTVNATGTQAVSPAETTTYTLTATGPGGTQTASVTVAVSQPAPVINIFTADPEEIAAGASATLSWNVTDADTVTIDNGIGTVNAADTQSVTPAETTTYILTATGPGGTQTASVTVTVSQPAPVINTFTADPTEITAGASATLSWNVTDADTVTIDNGIGTVSATGTQAVSPAETTTYILTATGPGGTQTATVTVTAFVPTVDFIAEPETIQSGESATLTWESQYAESVSIDNSVGAVPLAGSVSVSPAETTVYTVTATGISGAEATDSVTVTVLPPAFRSGTVRYTYDDLHRLTGVVYETGDGEDIAEIGYGYDNTDNRVSENIQVSAD